MDGDRRIGEIEFMKENLATQLVGYFNAQVLAAYRNEPDKYVIETDDFHGSISVTDEYFRQLEAQGRTNESIHVRFGYRTLATGEAAIAAFTLSASLSLRMGSANRCLTHPRRIHIGTRTLMQS
jgi:hypothetical protein